MGWTSDCGTLTDAEVIQLFNEFSSDDRIRKITALEGTHERENEIKNVLQSIDREIRAIEGHCTSQCLRSCKELISLHNEISEYDGLLESVELTLSEYLGNLKEITDKIKSLQIKSITIQEELKGRKEMRDILSTYINQILVTPDLVATICQAPINLSYLAQIELVSKKLERAKQPGIRIYPSVQQSLPELQKLYFKGLHRLRDFLISIIDNMKQRQTNIQILQSTKLLRNKQFYHFLLEQHHQFALEIRSYYVQTMSQVYYSKFKSYVVSLSKLSLEGTSQELLGHVDWGGAATSTIQSSARRLVGNLLGFPGQTEQAVLSNRGNFFSLAGRESILQQLSDDPILSTHISNASELLSRTSHQIDSQTLRTSNSNDLNSNISGLQKYYPETLFRSHQKLLMDACTAEFLFLLEFFIDPPTLRLPSTLSDASSSSSSTKQPQSVVIIDSFGSRQGSPLELTDNVHKERFRRNLSANKMKFLFTDVFEKTLTLFLQHLKDVVMNSYDCIGLLLMATINDFNRLTMQKRKNPCLDSYLDEVQITIWPRLKIVFDQHIQSIKEVNPEDLIQSVAEAQRTHPHYATRRFAEFSSAFMVLSLRNVSLGFREIQGIEAPLSSLISSFETLLQLLSLSTSPDHVTRETANNHKIIFLINNYDLIRSVYLKRGIRSERVNRFEQLLQTQISAYVEIQLLLKFSSLVKFVQQVDSLLLADDNKIKDDIDDNDTNSALPCGIDLNEMETVGRHFVSSWQSLIHQLHKDAIQNFTNFSTGMDILKQILTELLLYYTRFQRVIRRVYPSQSERQLLPWIKQLVPTNAILAEIKTYSKAF